MNEGKELFGGEFALRHDRRQVADAGIARVEAAFEDGVAQQPDHERAQADAVIRVKPPGFSGQRERRHRIRDDHVVPIQQVGRNVPPDLDADG